MASNISTTGLDTDFPVAGRDNDSQGFRDNFANIKTNLDYAKIEIDDLQTGVARVDGDNNFDGNTQSNMILHITATKTGLVASPTSNFDYDDGNVQKLDISGATTIPLTGYPVSNYGCVRFIFTGVESDDSEPYIVDFTTTDFAKTYTDGNEEWTSKSFTILEDEVVIIDAFSPDGNLMFLRYIGKFTEV